MTQISRNVFSRRTMLVTGVAMATTPALAEGCQVGPPQHHKGPLVFMDYDQLELDASYGQVYYEPLMAQVSDRLDSNCESMRARMANLSVSHMDQVRSKNSISTEPSALTHPSLYSFMAGTGSNRLAIPPRCSSTPEHITWHWTSFL
jgi:hypothetical protein